MKKRICKGLKLGGRILLLFVVVSLIRPTWTPKIEGENSISELRMVEIGGENMQIMIRGCDRNNSILLFEDSAHFPQFEEVQKFYQWLQDTFSE